MAWVSQAILDNSASGITATSANNTVTLNKTNAAVFESGIFGVSVTEYTAGQTWQINVYHKFPSGQRILISESPVISSASAAIMPILNAEGATQSEFMGIPKPMEIDVVGNSAGVGITFSAIVSASLFSHD